MLHEITLETLNGSSGIEYIWCDKAWYDEKKLEIIEYAKAFYNITLRYVSLHSCIEDTLIEQYGLHEGDQDGLNIEDVLEDYACDACADTTDGYFHFQYKSSDFDPPEEWKEACKYCDNGNGIPKRFSERDLPEGHIVRHIGTKPTDEAMERVQKLFIGAYKWVK